MSVLGRQQPLQRVGKKKQVTIQLNCQARIFAQDPEGVALHSQSLPVEAHQQIVPYPGEFRQR